jgi:hypothetical protein
LAHTIAPVAQLVRPVKHGFGLVVQTMLAVHAPQVPLPLQTMFVPQLVPAAMLLPSTQVIVPDEQAVMPLRHGFGLPVQAMPAVQLPQAPEPLQTRLLPQLVPAALLVPSTQVEAPVAQEVMPFLQMFGLVVQTVPAVHGTHVPPALHTMFVPQLVPGALFPVSPQTTTPVTHEVAPVLHGFAGWQATAGVHAPQMPLLHTMFVPHDVPLARFWFVSAQAIVGAHICVPAWQGLAGRQASPAVHATQTPALHTMFVPHEVPLATFPEAVQTGAPELHTMPAVRHGMPASAQVIPIVQAPHAPVALQTMFVPQLVPAGRFVPASVQVGVPVAHASVPL